MVQPIAMREAELYDAAVSDWPGEIEFYLNLATEAAQRGSVLEVGCGTGRVALRMAQAGMRVAGPDLSSAMLGVARAKSIGVATVDWVEGDMRSFELGERFALAIIPGHSFQFMLTPSDQVACLECVRRHLAPGGRLVVHLDHQSVDWLGTLLTGAGGVFQAAEEVIHPQTGHLVRASRAWWYEPATQTASAVTVREELREDGQVIGRWETAPRRLHCVFRFEMEHLLARAGYAIEALYGDFCGQALQDDSAEMIWVARTGRPGDEHDARVGRP